MIIAKSNHPYSIPYNPEYEKYRKKIKINQIKNEILSLKRKLKKLEKELKDENLKC